MQGQFPAKGLHVNVALAGESSVQPEIKQDLPFLFSQGNVSLNIIQPVQHVP